MRGLLCFALTLSASFASAASSWGFEDATLSIHTKGAGAGGASKEKFSEHQVLPNAVTLGSQDTLKILLTTKEGNKAQRPHQTFLHIKDSSTGLETSFSFQVKESGKGKLELAHKDIPIQLLSSSEPLTASLIIASFGTSTPYQDRAFDLNIEIDPNDPLPAQTKPLRYGKLPEIHHTFKADPTSPPKIITLVFTAAVVAALPALFIAWVSLGANLNHLSKALGASPVAHTLFFISILGLEGVFFLYYTHWKLYEALPSALGIGLVTFLSGSRALREVQQRRLAGFR